MTVHGLADAIPDTEERALADDITVLNDRRVYVIDNEPDILRSTRQVLTSWGMRVSVAMSIDAAESLFRNDGVPELLITDLRLRGEESGAALAGRLQAEHREVEMGFTVIGLHSQHLIEDHSRRGEIAASQKDAGSVVMQFRVPRL